MLVGELVGCEGGGRPISIDRYRATESVRRMKEIERDFRANGTE